MNAKSLYVHGRLDAEAVDKHPVANFLEHLARTFRLNAHPAFEAVGAGGAAELNEFVRGIAQGDVGICHIERRMQKLWIHETPHFPLA